MPHFRLFSSYNGMVRLDTAVMDEKKS